MKEKHNYTVKTYFDTTDEERILRDSEDFFANKYDIIAGHLVPADFQLFII